MLPTPRRQRKAKLPDDARQRWLGTGSDICINVTSWMAVLIAWVIPVKLLGYARLHAEPAE